MRGVKELMVRVSAAAAIAAASIAGAAEQAEATSPATHLFARAGGQEISVGEYEAAIASGYRQRFYHGRPPEGELERYRREVGEGLVMHAVLAAEAERRGVEPDPQWVRDRLAQIERRLGSDAHWQQARESLLPAVTADLERRSRVERLEAAVRAVPAPAPADARAFYDANPALFTEPERLRFSLILLRLDPGAGAAGLQAVQAEAEALHKRLQAGEDFAALARAHSKDASAAAGGDLGYLHRGMLPESIERQFADAMKPGEISVPVRVLEGMAIVRLDERLAPRLRTYDEVSASAVSLLRRERGERAWATLKSELRTAPTVWLDESRFAVARPN
jgi:hypothetical protein